LDWRGVKMSALIFVLVLWLGAVFYLIRLSNRNKSLKTELSTSRWARDSYQSQASTYYEGFCELKQELKNKTDELEQFKKDHAAQLNELATKLYDLNTELHSRKARNISLESDLGETKEELDRQKNVIEELSEINNELSAVVDRWEDLGRELLEHYDNAYKEVLMDQNGDLFVLSKVDGKFEPLRPSGDVETLGDL
jgi:chromosome segregation ATPase